MSQRYLRRIELKVKTAPHWAQGVGAFIEGNILLIGERPSFPKGARQSRDMGQPFCSLNGCSGWLNNLLEEEKIPEEKLFWINALYSNGDRVALWPYVEVFRPSYVITLGKVAERQCTEQDVTHENVPHPQYWKRFQSRKRYPLLDLLRRCLINVPDPTSKIESTLSLMSSSINRHADHRVMAVS